MHSISSLIESLIIHMRPIFLFHIYGNATSLNNLPNYSLNIAWANEHIWSLSLALAAYIIFEGGGVKGAAFAGCLQALEILRIKPVAFGGCSAGAIAAALAASGMSGNELADFMLKQMNFSELLDPKQPSVDIFETLFLDTKKALTGLLPPLFRLKKHKTVLDQLSNHFGLHGGKPLEKLIADKIKKNCNHGKAGEEITFEEFASCDGTLPLKILATNVTNRCAAIYETNGKQKDRPIVEAVRASMSYPFAFTPVIMGRSRLVDGGLCSNLPVFLFRDEHAKTGRSFMSFDLVTEPPPGDIQVDYNVQQFVKDVVATALESSDKLLLDHLPGIYRIQINIPHGYINTLDFSIKPEKIKNLINIGFAETIKQLGNRFQALRAGEDLAEILQQRYGVPALFSPVLKALKTHIEGKTKAKNVRCQVMLPTSVDHRRIVVYQCGMTGHTDEQLALKIDGGCTGRAFVTKSACVADLIKTKMNPAIWNMSVADQRLVNPDQKSIMAVPLFGDWPMPIEPSNGESTVIGTLSVDSSTELSETGWISAGSNGGEIENLSAEAREPMLQWSDVLSRMLSSRG